MTLTPSYSRVYHAGGEGSERGKGNGRKIWVKVEALKYSCFCCAEKTSNGAQ
jgi:hypothetical protein